MDVLSQPQFVASMVIAENSHLLLLVWSAIHLKYALLPVDVLNLLPSFVSMVHVWLISLYALQLLRAVQERFLARMALVPAPRQAVLRNAHQPPLFCVWMVHARLVYQPVQNQHRLELELVVQVEAHKRVLAQLHKLNLVLVVLRRLLVLDFLVAVLFPQAALNPHPPVKALDRPVLPPSNQDARVL